MSDNGSDDHISKKQKTSMSVSYGQWIGNKDVPSADPKRIEVENPSNHSIVGTVPAGCEADAIAALKLAKEAQPEWAKKSPVQRAGLLKQLATVIRENRDALIGTLVQEQPKVKSFATVEIDFTAEYFDYHAGLARVYEGEIVNSDNANEHIYVHRAPIGVSVGIVPWNFPFFVMARKLAPALLAGCTVVVKSSELTPLTSFLFTSFVTKALEEGKIDKDLLKPGIFSIVTGYGNTIGEALTKSSIPGIISMTGSVPTGQAIMRNAAENMTKVSLELGGKAPCIVMEDADLDLAAQAIVDSRVGFSGQICNCAERVYVQESVYDAFLAKLVEKMNACTVGAPCDEPQPTFCGLMSQIQLDKVSGMVERAISVDKGKVLCGGKRLEGPGYKYAPTVIVDVSQKSEIVQKEVFGPVLPVLKFKTFDEALELANDCEYGLASSLFTNNYKYIERSRTELLFGETYINRFHFETIQGYHAGWRKSGIGGADGKHGLYEYLATKVMYVAY